MKDVREIAGKTIDDAIQKACDAFNVPREKLDVEILSEGSTGFLGILGVKPARIKARILSIDISMYTESEEKTAPDSSHDEETALEAKAFVEGVLSRIGFDFPVAVKPNGEDYIALNIQGDGGGLLIGRGGQTLDAIQYLTNKVLNKNGNGGKRIVLDTENYREKRGENLTALAEKLGEKAKRTKKPVTVNPMNAHDRRLIHMALQDDKELTTRSRGEGTFRKIIIIPKKSGKTKS
ncbi:MAG: RNA-binding cell elongation regulator Jag/EloR [Syntrophales bacterium]|nr:RNA-binding cell elongation regulator Jag/EloR [Syntrophales bacterium]